MTLATIRRRVRRLSRPVLGLLVLAWLVLHCQHCLVGFDRTAAAAAPVAAMAGCEHEAPDGSLDDAAPPLACECADNAQAAPAKSDPTFGIARDYGTPDFPLAGAEARLAFSHDVPIVVPDYADRGRFKPFEQFGVRLN